MYALECKTQDMGPFRLALLGANKQSDATATVDLVFDQYTEFSLTELQIGSMAPKNPPRLECSVHLTGYHMPMEEGEPHPFQLQFAGGGCEKPPSDCSRVYQAACQIMATQPYVSFAALHVPGLACMRASIQDLATAGQLCQGSS